MLITAVSLYLLCALALAALSLKYLLGPAPSDYHREILVSADVELAQTITGLFKALNTVIGSGFLAIAIGVATLAWFGVREDLLWAKLAVVTLGLIAGIPGSVAAKRLEQATGVKTPWRPGFAMTALVVVAFLLSII